MRVHQDLSQLTMGSLIEEDHSTLISALKLIVHIPLTILQCQRSD